MPVHLKLSSALTQRISKGCLPFPCIRTVALNFYIVINATIIIYDGAYPRSQKSLLCSQDDLQPQVTVAQLISSLSASVRLPSALPLCETSSRSPSTRTQHPLFSFITVDCHHRGLLRVSIFYCTIRMMIKHQNVPSQFVKTMWGDDHDHQHHHQNVSSQFVKVGWGVGVGLVACT